jgi:glycosyltransferase involved in cell wall biosynthesis
MGTNSLRLAIDAGPLYGHRTGVAEAADGMIGALSERRDVDVEPYLVSFRSRPAEGHRRLPFPGLVASHLWSRHDRPRIDRWIGAVDVVHGTNYVAPPTRRPTVISVYDCWFLMHPEAATPVVRRAGSTLRRAAARGAWIHASSEATAEAARSLLDTDRVATIHLGPPPIVSSTSAVAPAPPAWATPLTGTEFIVAIATEERRKALALLVQAFALLALDDPGTHLVLAGGRGDDTEAITAAIDALPMSAGSRVHRLGRVDDSAKRWLLHHASVLAYPSVDEGFGFPILEAQAAGTPVIASRAGAIAEIAGSAAVLIEQPTPEAFASGLAAVLGGSPDHSALIEAGYRNVGRFSWDQTANALVDLYRHAMEEHP